MADAKTLASGRGIEAGCPFHAAVTAWVLRQFAGGMPIGPRFGLPGNLKAVGLQSETGDAVDDVVVRLEGGGGAYLPAMQNAAGASLDAGFPLGASPNLSPFGSSSLGGAARGPESRRACRVACSPRLSQRARRRLSSDGMRRALDLLDQHVRAGWSQHSPTPPTGGELVDLARVFRIYSIGDRRAKNQTRVWRLVA
jgi:hypothetical protein